MLASVSSWGMIGDVADQTRGQQLAGRWERARIKQGVLAKRAGVSTRTLQHLKMGKDAEKDMGRSIAAVERVLDELIDEATPPDESQAPQRRLRAVEAHIRDQEDVVGVTAETVRPGVRRMTIVLLDSDAPLDDATRQELERLLAESRPNPDNR